MHITFQTLLKFVVAERFLLWRQSVRACCPHFLLVSTLRGWRLGEGGCSSQLQLYLCPAVDSPLSAALSSVKRASSFPEQPNLSRSLTQIGVILSGGCCLSLITAKPDEKANADDP